MDRIAPASSPNAFRSTYLNAFNQIFDNSINVNCICKTTVINLNKTIPTRIGPKQIFDNRNDDFMSSDEEENSINTLVKVQQSNVSNFLDEIEKKLTELDLIPADDPRISTSQCDCSCFENLRCVYNVLKNCFRNFLYDDNLEECYKNFETKWYSFKFLSTDPSRCCDYYGTTIFHYAASDNSYELLKSMLIKCPNGVTCLDNKGMTPLMRASQRNNFKCIEYLLNETSSDLNGSPRSTYTPLWFTVSNGFTELAKLLLDYNTNPSINETVNKSEDVISEDHRRETLRGTSIYLFSPLRASIVYSKFPIMIYLLQYGANIYELFGSASNHLLNEQSNLPFNQLINDDYVNSLKFFHRQLGSKSLEHEKYLKYLNDFIENKNIYRRMVIELVKNICSKIKTNFNLMARIDQFLLIHGKCSIYTLMEATFKIENQCQNDISFSEYLLILNDFIYSIDRFIEKELNTDENHINNRRDFNEFFQIATQKPNYLKSLFECGLYLIDNFFKPITLKEICRFKIRKLLFKKIEQSNLKYKREFLKSNHQELILNECGLPTHLINYLLYKSI